MNGWNSKFTLAGLINDDKDIKDKKFILENIFNEDLVGEDL